MFIYSFFRSCLHLILPNNCGICSQHLVENEQHICLKCLYALPYTKMSSYENTVKDKLVGRINLHLANSFLYFEKNNIVKDILHQIKYKNKKDLAIFMGELWAKKTLLEKEWQDIDLILPVPLSPKKLYQRGYNQSALIARGIAKILAIPLVENIISRTKYTESQTFKTRMERIENISDAFTSKQLPQNVQHVLLVDDVITTGATIEMCALALMDKNPNIKISIATLALAH